MINVNLNNFLINEGRWIPSVEYRVLFPNLTLIACSYRKLVKYIGPVSVPSSPLSNSLLNSEGQEANTWLSMDSS